MSIAEINAYAKRRKAADAWLGFVDKMEGMIDLQEAVGGDFDHAEDDSLA